MIMALAFGRIEFIRLLLDRGVSIQTILTNEVLQFLYGHQSHCENSTLKYLLSENDYVEASSTERFRYVINYICRYSGIDTKFGAISRTSIEAIIQKLCGSFVCVGHEKFTEVCLLFGVYSRGITYPWFHAQVPISPFLV